jgi:hypothetical protein
MRPLGWIAGGAMREGGGEPAFYSIMMNQSGLRSWMPLCLQWLAIGSALLTARATVLINEIHYHQEVKLDPIEFIELHNPLDAPVDLSYWSIDRGVRFTFPLGSWIEPGGYAVIAQNPAALKAEFGVESLGPWEGRLSNSGERIRLVDALGNQVNEVRYQAGFPWPTVGDAPGDSIELVNPAFDNTVGGNWRRSLSTTGSGPTPGARNSVYAENLGPAIDEVAHDPREPSSGERVRITARVTDPDGVTAVTLWYQVVEPGRYIQLEDPEYETQWTPLPMNDTGIDGDEVGGDHTYMAEIPSTTQEHRRLVRYRITATDGAGYAVSVPYTDDPQPNFAYFVYDGVPAWRGAVRPGVTAEFQVAAEEMSRLPVYHLISHRSAVEAATWLERYRGSDYKWRGTLVYDGRVYDHIRYRARGGVWRYAMVKNMWKFRFNRGHELQARDNWGNPFGTTWRRLNLGASIQQGDYNHRGEQGMFESVGFRLFNLAGVEAPHTAFATFRVVMDLEETRPDTQYEGDFWGVYLAVEQPDRRFLEEHELPNGNLYKMEGGTGELNNLGITGPEDKSDLHEFLRDYTGASDAWWQANFDLDRYYSYQAIVQGIHHYDICYDKNFFYFRDPFTGLWSVHPWDLDLTWAENMFDAGCGGVDRIKARLLNGTRPAMEIDYRNRVREIRDLLFNDDQAWQLIDEYARLLRGQGSGPTILDADRAMWDYNPKMTSPVYSTHPSSKAGTGRFYRWPDPYSKDFSGLVQLMKNYVVFRSTTTTGRDRSLDQLGSDPLIPETPVIAYVGPAGYPANRLQFEASPYSGREPFATVQWRLGEITRTGHLQDPTQPHRYEMDAVWLSEEWFESGARIPLGVVRPGGVYRARARVMDVSGRWSHWSSPVEFEAGEPDNVGALVEHLKVTELMYDAPGGSEFDYIELWNQSEDRTLDLGGVSFTDGVTFTFPSDQWLEPRQFLLVVRAAPEDGFAAFRTHYGLAADIAVAGPYSGNFSRNGERVELQTPGGEETILAFTYGPWRGWPLASAGAGHSLVPLERSYRRQDRSLDYGGNWRASTYIGGSPGRADPEPLTGLRLEELLVYAFVGDPPGVGDAGQWIEVFNPTPQPVDLRHYYLSDRHDDMRRWALPPGSLAGGERLTCDELSWFGSPEETGFRLNPAGGELYLSYLPGRGEDRVVDSAAYLGQEPAVSLGRAPGGGAHYYRLLPTRDQPNSSPVESVVISELMYNPPRAVGQEDNTLDEFLELFNPTDEVIALSGVEGGWRVADGIRYQFPSGTQLPAGGYLLLVNFDPAEADLLENFRARYRVRADLPILGPYEGNLSNSGERVSLEKPQAPVEPGGPVVWVLIDEVIYFDRDPWPREADANGASLHRLRSDRSGNDPGNWVAAMPAPGGTRFGEGNLPPIPTGLVALGGLGQILLEWQVTATATGYHVYRAGSSAGMYERIAESLTSTTYRDDTVLSGVTYYYVVSAVNSSGQSPFSVPVAAVSASGEGVILREWWLGIPGNSVLSLTSHPRFPDQPSGSDLLPRFEAPTNWADEYGTRVRGFLHPPVTGQYTFYIAGDDQCELWLGADASPEDAALIARVPGWTNPREWTRYAEQRSAPVALEAGRSYYIEALHKEGNGGDNLAVAWQGPGLNLQVIEGTYLAAWTGRVPNIPTGLTAVAGADHVVLSWREMASGTTYRVYRATVAGGPYALMATGLASADYLDQDVINGTTLFYVVSAVVDGEEGPLSKEVSATPRAPVALADYPAAVLSAGPIAYWRLNEFAGEGTAYDELEMYHGNYGAGVILEREGPRPPGWQGLEPSNTAAQFTTGMAGSYVTIPPLGISTDTLTFSAWINPTRVVDWGGIVFYRSGGGSASGFNLRAGGDLGYHWNDVTSTYTWSSGLVPPLHQWTLVALVVEPTRATIHLAHAGGHLIAEHIEPHGPRMFDGNLRIGGDPFGDERVFEGRLDEVAVFDRALSWEEIEWLYASAVEGGPPTLRIRIQTDGHIVIEWESPGILQSTERLAGPSTVWTEHPTTERQWVVAPTDVSRFYRLAR